MRHSVLAHGLALVHQRHLLLRLVDEETAQGLALSAPRLVQEQIHDEASPTCSTRLGLQRALHPDRGHDLPTSPEEPQPGLELEPKWLRRAISWLPEDVSSMTNVAPLKYVQNWRPTMRSLFFDDLGTKPADTPFVKGA